MARCFLRVIAPHGEAVAKYRDTKAGRRAALKRARGEVRDSRIRRAALVARRCDGVVPDKYLFACYPDGRCKSAKQWNK